MSRPSLGLAMIVKNEASILPRCLAAVRPFLNYWTISDTGSTDGTPDVVQECLRGIPGKLAFEPWVNFEHNRNLNLAEALNSPCDYSILIDADMELRVAGRFPDLTLDAYYLPFTGECDYSVIRLISHRHEWRYRGATHEYVESPTGSSHQKSKELSIIHHEDGSNRSAKYHRDIALLLEALKQDPETPRNVYYLAQSYRDVGDYVNAALYYERRIPMGGWIEETWHALYQLGRMQALLGSDLRVVQHTYLQAYNLRPTRLEPAYALARFYRENGQYALGFHFARLVNEVFYPDDLLIIERDVYDYLLRIEYGLCCEALGRTKEAIGAFETVLESVRMPQELRSSVEQKLSNHTGCHFRSSG